MMRILTTLLAALTLAACEHTDWELAEQSCDPYSDARQCQYERKLEPLCPLDPKSCEELREDNPDPFERIFERDDPRDEVSWEGPGRSENAAP